MMREGESMLAALGREDYVVALEVSGKAMSTEQVSAWLAERLRNARPLALLIGGPDGLAQDCRARAQYSWSLSPLTLPHALVRVVLAEQLYRAMSVLAGHPYHRG
jgi:23S rRNA (pseudouridine1915-N3)-methyltransferase